MQAGDGYAGYLVGENSYKFSVNLSNPTMMFTSMSAVLKNLEKDLEQHRAALDKAGKDIEELTRISQSGFAKADELVQKQTRYDEIMEILNPKQGEQELYDEDDGGNVQYSLKSNWNNTSGVGELIDFQENTDAAWRQLDIYGLEQAEIRDFERQFADLTNDMPDYVLSDEDERGIIIHTTNKRGVSTAFMVRADGRMRGIIRGRYTIDGHEEEVRNAVKQWNDVALRDGESATNNFGEWYARLRADIDRFSSGVQGLERGTEIRNGSLAGGFDSSAYGRQYYGTSFEDSEEDYFPDDEYIEGSLTGGSYALKASSLGNWQVLSMAAEGVIDEEYTAAERAALDTFREKLDAIHALRETRTQLGAQYKEQNFTKGGDKAEAARSD